MKKNLIIVLILIVIFGIGVGAYYYVRSYEYNRSPEYSLQQMQVAFQEHDLTDADKYVDVNSISSNTWQRAEQELLNLSESNALDVAMQASSSENNVVQQINAVFLGTAPSNSNTVSIFQQLMTSKNIIQNSTNALVKINYQIANSVSFNLTGVLTQQSDGTWQMTDIQGFDLVLTSLARDVQRDDDLNTMEGDLQLYYNQCGSYPGGADDKCMASTSIQTWGDLTNALLKNVTSIGSVPNDPLPSSTYLYGVATSGQEAVIGAVMEDNYPQITQLLEKGAHGNFFGVNCATTTLCWLQPDTGEASQQQITQ